jgi:hypothetical protein
MKGAAQFISVNIEYMFFVDFCQALGFVIALCLVEALLPPIYSVAMHKGGLWPELEVTYTCILK